MNLLCRKLLFDRADYELLRSIDEASSGGPRNRVLPDSAPELHLHPRGIRELAEPQAVRLTRAMMSVLDTLDTGPAAMNRRLAALRELRDELLEGLDVPLRFNTARVILEVIKELIRLRQRDPYRRLRLAHDLRSAMLGNPLFIRRLLKRYHLVEMPENWTPVTFDQHVHDANTKGRKSPSHLIMDAWIKGLVKLQVIYYNYVPRDAAEEVLRAAGIMKIDVRIGVEFRALYRGRFVEMIWAPRGFSGAADYLKFLDRPKTGEFTRKCRKAANFRRRLVLETLAEFNANGRHRLEEHYGVRIGNVSDETFLASVAYGQPSIEHISELLVVLVRRELQKELDALEAREEERSAVGEERRRKIRAMLGELSAELLRSRYIDQKRWDTPPADLSELPEISRYSPEELLNELHKVASGFRMTLNLTDLPLEEVLEILYDCRGEITTLEIYNLKDEAAGRRPDDSVINSLRHALNSGAVVKLKNIIRLAINRTDKRVECRDRVARLEKLRRILRDMPRFIGFYARSPLGVSIGSDSASRPSPIVHGMGMAVIDTLTPAVRREIRRVRVPELSRLHVTSDVYRTLSYFPRSGIGFRARVAKFFGFGYRLKVEWVCCDEAQSIDSGLGNLAALGGFFPSIPQPPLTVPVASLREFWRYLNSNARIFCKVLIGFLAAFFTFYLGGRDTWWVLTWFGAVIWLGITGVRNIIQSVLAGGGLRNSPLLKWNDFISWQRVADSLLYTGLSVPLLEYVVKTVVLRQWCGWTAENEPLLVFGGIALANGIYISGHNLLRAFPKSAVWGNWLRAPLSIPLAMFFNLLFGSVLTLLRVPGVEEILQQWAAILSKLASDCIGGVIEAQADRARNLAARFSDFRTKLHELFELAAKVELLLPEDDLPALLRSKHSFFQLAGIKRSNLLNLFYVNALDMMYIWMRQPQAVAALEELMAKAPPEERLLFLKTQEILTREKSISKLFLNGLVGRNFSRALAFYLRYYRNYLDEIQQLEPEWRHEPVDWNFFPVPDGGQDTPYARS